MIDKIGKSIDKIKLAIVDDNIFYRKILAIYLKEYSEIEICISVNNGKELFKALEKKTPHLVLLDLEMPVMDGYKTTEYLKKGYSDIKILIHTVHKETEISQQLIQLGANGFLHKDGGLEKIHAAIHSIMKHEYYFAGWDLKEIIASKYKDSSTKRTLPEDIKLTERELQVLQLICKQYTNKEIADKLFISKRTVDGHRDNLLKKTNNKTKAGLALYAQTYGLNMAGK